MLTLLLAHKNGFFSEGTHGRLFSGVQQQGLQHTETGVSMEAPYALNSMEGSSMTADAAANNKQVIVILALCCC